MPTNFAEIWPIIAAGMSLVGLIISGLVGMIVKASVIALRDLRLDHDKMRSEVNQVHLLLVGKFITRDDSDRAREAIVQRFELMFTGMENRVRTLEIATHK
jgi:hypothetical protein